MQTFFTWFKRGALALLGMLLLVAISTVIYQRVSDGPTGPLAGGPFTSGEAATQPAQGWRSLEGDFEFELVGTGRSRTAGGIVLDDHLYITCDLGFIWNRLPAGTSRNILHLIWLFKTWHLDAQEDGRIRIRKGGKVYSAELSLVTDETENARLKRAMEQLAEQYFGAGRLGPAPDTPPNEVLFFRVN